MRGNVAIAAVQCSRSPFLLLPGIGSHLLGYYVDHLVSFPEESTNKGSHDIGPRQGKPDGTEYA